MKKALYMVLLSCLFGSCDFPSMFSDDLQDDTDLERQLGVTLGTTSSSTGTVTFYTNFSGGGPIRITVGGTYEGTLSSYYPAGSPNCGESSSGAVSVRREPGTFNYYASNSQYYWSGTVTFQKNTCTKFLLR